MSEFGNFLKKEISRNKLSQNKFAEKVGISSYYVGQMIKLLQKKIYGGLIYASKL